MIAARKNYPTLKSLWKNLIAAMKWAELDIDHLQAITVKKYNSDLSLDHHRDSRLGNTGLI